MSSCLFEGDSHLHKLLVVRVAKADSQDKIPAAQGTDFLQKLCHKAKTAQKLPSIAILSCACLADFAKVHAMDCVQLNAVDTCLLAAQGRVHKGLLVPQKVSSLEMAAMLSSRMVARPVSMICARATAPCLWTAQDMRRMPAMQTSSSRTRLSLFSCMRTAEQASVMTRPAPPRA